MAFNKSKALESALKSLSQGKVAQAISEYQQILRQDPKDQATLMTVGDLYARQGDMPNAIEYFERLAQVYLSDGFNSKAIAIYKKIAKLAPAELPPLERLADLYVQQGVLSEARPLFLQIAEAHVKACRQPKAVEVLHRLLEVEPENPRVQMRLAEIYSAMGQKKEAAHTYFAYAQRLFDRGESEEAQKLVDRALDAEPAYSAAALLKAKVLAGAGKDDQAIALLENHPEADAGSDVTNLLVDLQIRAKHIEDAADRARNQLVRGNSHYGLLLRVAETLLDSPQPGEALPLLRELRDPMIDVGEQDRFLKSLNRTIERLPKEIDPLEMLADFSRHTSDPFHLNSALTQLVDIHSESGNLPRAEQLLQELIERNKGDERLVARLNEMRQSRGAPAVTMPAVPPATAASEVTVESASSQAVPVHASAPVMDEPQLDEETQHYIAQALTDVDLFSSYGLVQKATHLLETVLQRAPRHTPTLERLLDMYLGAGNERRTAELASLLEQIHIERQDHANVERFAELRQRFQTIAGLSTEELLAAAAVPLAPPAPEAAPAEEPSALEDFTLEMEDGELSLESVVDEPAIEKSASVPEFEIALAPAEEPEPVEAVMAAPVAPQADSSASADELDLSDEWEAMVLEVADGPIENTVQAQVEPSVAAPPEIAPQPAEPIEFEISASQSADALEIDLAEIAGLNSEEAVESLQGIAEEAVSEESVSDLDPPMPAPEPVAADIVEESPAEFELELTPETVAEESAPPLSDITTDEFISQLAAEFEDLEPLQASHQESNGNGAVPVVPQPVASAGQPVNASTEIELDMDSLIVEEESPRTAISNSFEASPVLAASQQDEDSLNELSAVFQEFRSEMGEAAQDEDEDLETHYNLGIAYREMGLLDESIGEFQKVANAIQKGKPFNYVMNCYTLLALCFLDKGEPKIASMWYERALEVPGIDAEAVLALRYDLGVALEMAGDSEGALDRFRQVYAANIDYRDVADHIASLQHQ
jgi:tetratricopeptide (TPR) repeat protein